MAGGLLALVFVANVVSVAEVPSPRPSGWVTDQANVLDDAAEAKLNGIAESLHGQNGIELAVVTVDDVAGTPKQFATELFNTWKIGNAQTNNGVLVLLVMGKRRLEVETGTGIEAALPAQWLADMQVREMVPMFKARQFGDGLVAGVQAIAAHLRDAPAESDSTAPKGEYRSNDTTAPSQPQPLVSTPARDDGGGAHPLFPFALGAIGAAGVGGTGLLLRQRKRRKTCFTCEPSREMLALSEVEDDEHLDEGQRTEERIGSVDYEVLICPGCQASRTLRHGRWFSGYSKCGSCHYKTLKTTSTTIVAATYDHGGQVQVNERCSNCDYNYGYTKYTSAMTRPSTSTSSFSSSSSSSGYSSSSSGFGGGSSSGGGAGSSW